MENVLQYEIPVLHPLAVHFPLALTVAAALAVVLWLIRGTALWRRCGLFLYTLALAGTILAYLTGDAIEEHVEGTPIVEELVDLHEDMALYTLILTGITFAGLAGVSFWVERRTTIERDPHDPLWVRLVLTLLALAAAALVTWTGHIGSTMVWGVAG